MLQFPSKNDHKLVIIEFKNKPNIAKLLNQRERSNCCKNLTKSMIKDPKSLPKTCNLESLECSPPCPLRFRCFRLFARFCLVFLCFQKLAPDSFSASTLSSFDLEVALQLSGAARQKRQLQDTRKPRNMTAAVCLVLLVG